MQAFSEKAPRPFLFRLFVAVFVISWLLFALGFGASSSHSPGGDFLGGLVTLGGVIASVLSGLVGLIGLTRKGAPRMLLIAGILFSPLSWYLAVALRTHIAAERELRYYEQHR